MRESTSIARQVTAHHFHARFVENEMLKLRTLKLRTLKLRTLSPKPLSQGGEGFSFALSLGEKGRSF